VQAGAQDLGDADVVDVEGHSLALQDGRASVRDLRIFPDYNFLDKRICRNHSS
jgi:hypothetical protein